MSNRTKKQIFTNIEVLDAGAKGKTIAKAPDGKVIFLPNTVPGDVVDVQTFKKRKAYYEGVGHKTRRQCSRVRFGSFVQDHQARI